MQRNWWIHFVWTSIKRENKIVNEKSYLSSFEFIIKFIEAILNRWQQKKKEKCDKKKEEY